MSQTSQTWRFVRRWWPVVVAAVVMVGVVGLVSLIWLIELSAHNEARLAQSEFRGDEVEALIQVVQSEHHTLHDRNHAVWALGRMRDQRGLPVLLKYYTGQKCDHARFLCQSELKKAIDLCSGRTTAPAWLEKLQRAVGRSVARL